MKKKVRVVFLAVAAVVFIACLVLARTTIANLLLGNVSFPAEHVGEVLTMEDGQKFTVFRRLQVNGFGDTQDRPAVFKVRFRFRDLSTQANMRLSIIPAPFLMGMAGFREKDWTINRDTNEFQGIYQWSSRAAAEQYPASFIFQLMTRRAAPGTVSYEVIPDTDITGYLALIRSGSPGRQGQE